MIIDGKLTFINTNPKGFKMKMCFDIYQQEEHDVYVI